MVQPLTNSIGLRMAYLGLGVLDCPIARYSSYSWYSGLPLYSVPPGRQDPKQRYLMFLKERQNPVIEDIGGSYSLFTLIEFRKGNPSISVDKVLLVNTSDALDIADIRYVLAIGWIIQNHLDNGLFDSWFDADFQNSLLPANFLQGCFSAHAVQVFDSVKTISAVTDDSACLGNIA